LAKHWIGWKSQKSWKAALLIIESRESPKISFVVGTFFSRTAEVEVLQIAELTFPLS
jgi:hypothetical protein